MNVKSRGDIKTLNERKLTDIPGIRIGHAQNIKAATGCTVIVCENGAVAGVDVRGGSPGTIQTDTLNPQNIGKGIHAVLLAGGSAFGLEAASGVSQYLEEKGIGRDVQVTKVPIVCGAILFDMLCGDYRIRPDKQMGYEACRNAFQTVDIAQGSVGAGTGAVIGKIKGMTNAMKGGIGTSCIQNGDLLVGAVVAVNCVGDIYDRHEGRLIAGMLNDDKTRIESTENYMLQHYQSSKDFFSGNTVIGAVITNAGFSKSEINKLASISHDGIARTIRPSHCIFDGDTLFALSVGNVNANISAVGIMAVRAVESAILSGIRSASSLAGIPTYNEIIHC